MSAYLIVDVTAVFDAVSYAAYCRQAPSRVAAAGGRYLVRGGRVDVLEGGWAPGRVVVVEFPSPAAAHAWWQSDDYRALRDLRQASTRTQMIVVAGTEHEESQP